MTEAEWLACDKPITLLINGPLTPRRERLLAVAFCRRIRGLLIDTNSLRSLDIIEAFADGNASPEELRLAWETAVENWDEFEFSTAFDDAQRQAVAAVTQSASPDDPLWYTLEFATNAVEMRGTHGTVVPSFVSICRDVVGNPFRPVALDPAWLTSDVLALARGIYEERAFDRMPILADALQDAGCTNEDVLTHCRDPKQVHVRGCWLLDLLLGKG
jgi:hypothetical protein